MSATKLRQANSSWRLVNLSTRSEMSLRRKQSKLTVVSLIPKPVQTFNARSVGTTHRPLKIPSSIHASVMVLCGTFIMSAWNIGSSKRWPRRRRKTWFLILGNSSSVKFAKSPIHTYSDQTVSLIDSSMSNRIFLMTEISCSSSLWLLRKTVRGWSILSCQILTKRYSNWEEAMKVM